MAVMLLELFRHILTLLFGVAVSALLLGVDVNKKNITILSVFVLMTLAVQGVLMITHNETVITMIYPLIIHLPLLLLFVLLFKKRLFPAILSITTAYLCCQIANWFSIIPTALGSNVWVTDAVYTIVLIITFIFAIKLVTDAFSKLLAKQTKELLAFGIIPVFYYIFDYASTVYTQLLHAGHIVAIEFTPFLMSICYLIFCTSYFKQYEEKMEAESLNKMMSLKQKQSDKEISLIKQNEKNIALLRHDMRHFFSNILNYIENDESEQAKEYIHSIIESVDSTAIKKYCSNETVNMILSSYENDIIENHIDFKFSLNIPKEVPIEDVDLTSILSNGMENAINAVLTQDVGKRIIELDMSERNGKLLISLENTYGMAPEFADGLPVTGAEGHGFGTQSIYYTSEKLKGNCHFSVVGDRFVLQVIL